MSKFKVGDKVKYLNPHLQGMKGEIVEVNFGTEKNLNLVYFEGWGGGHDGTPLTSKGKRGSTDYYFLADDELELIKEKKQKQILIGKTQITESTKVKAEWNVEGFEKEGSKINHRTLLSYRTGNVITCVLKTEVYKGVGIARCHPDDKFDIYKGIWLAELRAKENFYKNMADSYAKSK